MTKYSYELKKKVVSAYLNDEGGYEYLSKKYDISHHDIVRRWVKSYNKFGDKGLARSRQNNNYSFQFKLSGVKNKIGNNKIVIKMRHIKKLSRRINPKTKIE